MVKFIVEYLSGDGISEEDIRKAICEGDDSVVHDSELFVKQVDDEDFEQQINLWMKENGYIKGE